MRKFKAGDKVKVKLNETDHGFDIGKRLKVIETYDNGKSIHCQDKNKRRRAFKPNELKLIKPKLTEKRIREIVREELKPPSGSQRYSPVYWNGGVYYDFTQNDKPKEEPKPKSGWYKDDKFPKRLTYKNFENDTQYGLDARGNWFNDLEVIGLFKYGNEHLADPKEVEQRLIDHILSIERSK